jgi:hypothetical protein
MRKAIDRQDLQVRIEVKERRKEGSEGVTRIENGRLWEESRYIELVSP